MHVGSADSKGAEHDEQTLGKVEHHRERREDA